jgi:hypothetical protein
VIGWLTSKQRNLEEVKTMNEENDFIVGIFRVADVPTAPLAAKSVQGERYIALVPEMVGNVGDWQTSDTLFGLQKKMKLITVINWVEAERELANRGYYKVSRTSSEEEKGAIKEARFQSVVK